MKTGDKDKLNVCLDILDSTDLGMSLVWLWTWSVLKDLLENGDWDQLVSEDEAWGLLCKAVESGYGFTLEYGANEHQEMVLDWALDNGLITHLDDLNEDEEDDTRTETT